MKFITNTIYSQLKQGEEDIYMSKHLNLDLFKCLYPYEINDDKNIDDIKNKDFREKYRLKYFGELIERFDERGIVKDIKDLRTLVFVAINILEEGNTDYNTHQDRDFILNIIDKMNTEFDYITAATILQTSNEVIVKNSDNLIEKIISSLESNINFELAVYGVYSCIKYLDTRSSGYNKYPHFRKDPDKERYQSLQRRLIKLFENIDLVPYSEDNLNDYPIYIMQSEICNKSLNLISSADFKNKKIFKYIRSMSNMQDKVIGHDVSIYAAQQNLNMNSSIIRFLNYKTIHSLEIRRNLSDNKLIKLKLGLWSYLNEDKEIPDLIWREIKDDISNQCVAERGYSRSREKEDVSTTIAGKVSKINFNKVLSIENELDFYRTGWVKYFLEDNKDLYALLSHKSKESVITKALDDTEDKEKIKNYISLLEGLGINKMLVTETSLGLKILEVEEELDVIKALGRRNHRVLKTALEKIKCNYPLDEYAKYLIELVDNGVEIDISMGSKEYKNSISNNACESLIEEIEAIKLCDIKNTSLKKHLQELKDKITILGLKRDRNTSFLESYTYMINNLKDVNYLRLMGISKEDKLDILKHIKSYVEAYIEYGYEEYSNLLDDLSILIEKSSIHDNLDIRKCRSFIKEIGKTEEISLEQKAKIDSVAQYIVNDNKTTIKDIRNLLIEIGEKNKSGLLNDSDLLQILKNGLLQINN